MDQHCPNVPFILLALKIDEYKQKENKFITKKQGESLSSKLKSNGFFELSPKKPKGINDLFQRCGEIIIKETIFSSKTKKRKSLAQKLFGVK